MATTEPQLSMCDKCDSPQEHVRTYVVQFASEVAERTVKYCPACTALARAGRYGEIMTISRAILGGLVTEPQTQAEWIDLLSERIAESEFSARQFALRVLLRDEVTVRRWLRGENPIPNVVRKWLVKPEKSPWP